jgi:hypothetical protein
MHSIENPLLSRHSVCSESEANATPTLRQEEKEKAVEIDERKEQKRDQQSRIHSGEENLL